MEGRSHDHTEVFNALIGCVRWRHVSHPTHACIHFSIVTSSAPLQVQAPRPSVVASEQDGLVKCYEPWVRCDTQCPNNLSISNQSWFRSKMIWSTTSSVPCLDQVLRAVDQRIVPQRLLRLHANSINMVLFPYEGGPRSGPRTLKSRCLVGCLYALGISLLVSVSGQCEIKIQLLLLLIFWAAPRRLSGEGARFSCTHTCIPQYRRRFCRFHTAMRVLASCCGLQKLIIDYAALVSNF